MLAHPPAGRKGSSCGTSHKAGPNRAGYLLLTSSCKSKTHHGQRANTKYPRLLFYLILCLSLILLLMFEIQRIAPRQPTTRLPCLNTQKLIPEECWRCKYHGTLIPVRGRGHRIGFALYLLKFSFWLNTFSFSAHWFLHELTKLIQFFR